MCLWKSIHYAYSLNIMFILDIPLFLFYRCFSRSAVNTYEGTHDVHALILGRAITGMQVFAPHVN